MHPALRKGPLFYKKHPQFFTFVRKNIPIFHFFTKKHTSPHFISCLRTWVFLLWIHRHGEQCPCVRVCVCVSSAQAAVGSRVWATWRLLGPVCRLYWLHLPMYRRIFSTRPTLWYVTDIAAAVCILGPASAKFSVSSARQCLSCGGCLEMKRNIVWTALCCVVYFSRAQRYAHKYMSSS